jgi:hypothetical protein
MPVEMIRFKFSKRSPKTFPFCGFRIMWNEEARSTRRPGKREASRANVYGSFVAFGRRLLKDDIPAADASSYNVPSPLQAWYDGVIIKAEPRSHIQPCKTGGGLYQEYHCHYTIRFRPAVDTSPEEAPTFVKRISGTRKLAFSSFANGPIEDVISGRIREEDLKQSWRPEYRVDVSGFASDACINVPPQVGSNKLDFRTRAGNNPVSNVESLPKENSLLASIFKRFVAGSSGNNQGQ